MANHHGASGARLILLVIISFRIFTQLGYLSRQAFRGLMGYSGVLVRIGLLERKLICRFSIRGYGSNSCISLAMMLQSRQAFICDLKTRSILHPIRRLKPIIIKQFDSTLGYPGEGPVRVRARLGHHDILALVDTGADYDCINAELGDIQASLGNPAFVQSKPVLALAVGGWTEGQAKHPVSLNVWTLHLTGTTTLGGRQEVVRPHDILLHGFSSMKDDVIIGLPFIDAHLPCEVNEE